ncbi:hypothetical protein EV715DRAFT_297317 [Schizophyllum commune]
MRPARISQAWETGGNMLDAAARTWREGSRLSSSMQNEAGDQISPLRTAVPEPPEACVGPLDEITIADKQFSITLDVGMRDIFLRP